VTALLETSSSGATAGASFDVTIGGEPRPKLAAEMGVSRYLGAENLPAGEHDRDRQARR
jgi:hypothetical protein